LNSVKIFFNDFYVKKWDGKGLGLGLDLGLDLGLGVGPDWA
jgi:hypothetical protein